MDFLAQHPGSTTGDLAKGLNLNPGSVSTRLNQLTKAGEIKKASHGYRTKQAARPPRHERPLCRSHSASVESTARLKPREADCSFAPTPAASRRKSQLAGTSGVERVQLSVNGHLFLPDCGHQFSPLAAMFSPRWWPRISPPSGLVSPVR